MEGIGWYTHELMSRVVKNHPEHEFHFIFDRPYDEEFIYADNVHAHVVGPPTRHVLLIAYWFDHSILKVLKKIQPDVFFSPDSINSNNPVCKTVTTIHDVNFISNPGNFSLSLRKFYSKRTPKLAESSDEIVTVSEYSKGAISRLLNVPSTKIEVIYNACRPGFEPINDAGKKLIKEKYCEGNDFFFFVGGLYQRKNLVRLVEAFEIFKKKSKSNLKLLIVGQIVPEAKHLVKRVESSECKEDIILTDRINDDDEVKRIMASAFALTYVSVLEGFGMPMVEAMKSGIPIISSNTTCMPEIGGDAALYVNPIDPEDIAAKMLELTTNEDKRIELIRNAEGQSRKFDWDRSAEKLWEVFEDVINR